MKNKIYTILASLLYLSFASSSFAQCIIKGRIVDENEASVEYANIVALNKSDSTFISGGLSDINGLFRLETQEKAHVVLRVSFMGYENIYVDIAQTYGEIDLRTIKFKSKYLDLAEVSITASRPIFRQKKWITNN